MIDFIVKKLKGDGSYSVDNNIQKRDILIIIFQRGIQIFRGVIIKIFIRKSKGALFIGRRVKIVHKHRFECGSSNIIEDSVYINALSQNGVKFGNNVTIQRSSIIICTGVIRNLGYGVELGNNVGLNASVYLGGQGGIKIGNNVIIGPYAKIFSENHSFADIALPIKLQGESREFVLINDDCWIGSGVIILAGVNLGKGCVVAAGSVVTHSFPEYSIIAGIPAKIIKTRN